MTKQLTVAVLICAAGATMLAADAGWGIFTSCFNADTFHWQYDDSVICWREPPAGSEWSYYKTAFTDLMYPDPENFKLRWAYSGSPGIYIDTNYYYTFYAKSLVSGNWKYSEWSSSVYYRHPTTTAVRYLVLTRNTPPDDPNTPDFRQGGP